MTSIDTGPAWIPPDLNALAPLADEPEREAVAKETAPPGGTQEYSFFGKDGFSFDDVLDILNPLQHIPIVGTVYRAVTGDEIAAGPRMVGGALFGGPIGAALATANAVLEESSGKDAGEHILALFQDEGPQDPAQPPVTVAAATQSYAAPDLAALAPLPARPAAPEVRRETAETPDPAAVRAMPVAAVEAALVASKGDALAMDAIANPPGVGSEAAAHRDGGADGSEKPAENAGPEAEGWFPAAMMAALNRYEEMRDIAATPPAAVSATY